MAALLDAVPLLAPAVARAEPVVGLLLSKPWYLVLLALSVVALVALVALAALAFVGQPSPHDLSPVVHADEIPSLPACPVAVATRVTLVEKAFGRVGSDDTSRQSTTRVVVVGGMGGTGKSTLARLFVDHVITDGTRAGCVWLNGESHRALDLSIQRFVTAHILKGVPLLPSLGDAIRMFFAWVRSHRLDGVRGDCEAGGEASPLTGVQSNAHPTGGGQPTDSDQPQGPNKRWLIVVDNADDLDVASRLYRRLGGFSAGMGWDLLVSTRAGYWSVRHAFTGAEVVMLRELPAQDAALLVWRIVSQFNARNAGSGRWAGWVDTVEAGQGAGVTGGDGGDRAGDGDGGDGGSGGGDGDGSIGRDGELQRMREAAHDEFQALQELSFSDPSGCCGLPLALVQASHALCEAGKPFSDWRSVSLFHAAAPLPEDDDVTARAMLVQHGVGAQDADRLVTELALGGRIPLCVLGDLSTNLARDLATRCGIAVAHHNPLLDAVRATKLRGALLDRSARDLLRSRRSLQSLWDIPQVRLSAAAAELMVLLSTFPRAGRDGKLFLEVFVWGEAPEGTSLHAALARRVEGCDCQCLGCTVAGRRGVVEGLVEELCAASVIKPGVRLDDLTLAVSTHGLVHMAVKHSCGQGLEERTRQAQGVVSTSLTTDWLSSQCTTPVCGRGQLEFLPSEDVRQTWRSLLLSTPGAWS